MADENAVIENEVPTVSEVQVEEAPKETEKMAAEEETEEDRFELALERVTSKLWDDRPRSKSKGKRKRVSKEEEKNLVDQLIQASSQNETSVPEVLGRRFLEMIVESKTSESKVDELSRRCSLLTKDKEDLTGQYKKSRLALSKLENLCRELQKHNRLMKEECDHRTKAEEAKRQELSSKFQSSIGEITNQMQDNHTKNQQLKTDNAELAAKLKGLVDQYEMREQYVDKVLKHKQIENQLLEAKLAQQALVLNEEKEQSLKEKQMLLQESLEYKKKCEILIKEEAELKLQLSMYTEKFEEFQKTLTKSNEVFGTFKKEMDKMTKTIKKLEKETNSWKQKWERSNHSLIEMTGENKRKDQQVLKVTQKNEKLEKLCRALQIERRELSQKLEGNKDINGEEDTSTNPTTETVENGHNSNGSNNDDDEDGNGESELKPEAEQESPEQEDNIDAAPTTTSSMVPSQGELNEAGQTNGCQHEENVADESEEKTEEEGDSNQPTDEEATDVEPNDNETAEDELSEAVESENTEKESCEADQTAPEDDQPTDESRSVTEEYRDLEALDE